MEKFSDLRFIIGLFFFLAGLLLVGLAFFSSPDKEFGQVLNMYVGHGLLLFSAVMWWSNWRS
ncbi:MAG: hypothetical protein RLY31_2585 [Bacteroidota bacterium]|jgi:hypothetical protein